MAFGNPTPDPPNREGSFPLSVGEGGGGGGRTILSQIIFFIFIIVVFPERGETA